MDTLGKTILDQILRFVNGTGEYRHLALRPPTAASAEAGPSGSRSPGKGKAAYTQHWNAKYAPWIDSDTSQHLVLESATGKVLRTQSLTAKVDWRRYNTATGKHELLKDDMA